MLTRLTTLARVFPNGCRCVPYSHEKGGHELLPFVGPNGNLEVSAKGSYDATQTHNFRQSNQIPEEGIWIAPERLLAYQ